MSKLNLGSTFSSLSRPIVSRGMLAIAGAMILALAAGITYTFSPRDAGAAAPLQLQVITAGVKVNGQAVKTGYSLVSGDVISTDPTGRANISYPDGSLTRLGFSTELSITKAQVDRSGRLQLVHIDQKSGQTYNEVTHLTRGADFSIHARNANASVRGTKFGVTVGKDTIYVPVYEGLVLVQSSKGSIDVPNGQQTSINAAGIVGALTPTKLDPLSPFFWDRSTQLANQKSGSSVTSATSGAIASSGATVTSQIYGHQGGRLTAVASSSSDQTFTFALLDGTGRTIEKRNGISPQVIVLEDAAPGIYSAELVNSASSTVQFSVAFSATRPCIEQHLDRNGVVRQAFNAHSLAAKASSSGVNNLRFNIQPSTGDSILLTASGDLAGSQVDASGLLTASGSKLDSTVTSAKVNGITVRPDVLSSLTSSVNLDFRVDRVYTCQTGDGSTLAVFEGHR